MIQARVAKQFAAFTLDVDFEAQPGVTVLFGPSGAGKTVTLECLAGFLKPDSGRILLNDQILFDGDASFNLPPRQRNCGYVFQDHALFPHMTLWDNLAFGAERHPRLERHRRVSEMLEQFRLTPFAQKFPNELSGGQQQRCSIARALIAEPHMLLLDEPARGLDSVLRNELYSLARQVRAEYRIPIVLVTHDLEECFALGDWLIVLEGGKILQTGTPRAVYDRPKTPEIARLLGIENLLQAEVLALDPARNTSRIRLLGQEMTTSYFPGRLLGDRVTLSIPAPRVKVRNTAGPNRVAVWPRTITELAGRVRLEFENGVTADVDSAEFQKQSQWFAEFPPDALLHYGPQDSSFAAEYTEGDRGWGRSDPDSREGS